MTKACVLLALAAGASAAGPAEGPAVDAAWLVAHGKDAGVVIVDARTADAYAKGHVPGAVSLPVAETFAPGKSKNQPDAPERLAALFGSRGVGGADRVVAYDNGRETSAARLFWTLEYLGHPRAGVLDGGLAAWRAAGGAVSEEPATTKPRPFAARADAARLASKEEVRASLADPKIVFVDARTEAEFAGDDQRSKRGGHIPGAKNVEWTRNLRDDGRLLDRSALRALYEGVGFKGSGPVVTYCQTGQRSSVSYWALRVLGRPRVANYASSWAEWGNDPSVPVETAP